MKIARCSKNQKINLKVNELISPFCCVLPTMSSSQCDRFFLKIPESNRVKDELDVYSCIIKEHNQNLFNMIRPHFDHGWGVNTSGQIRQAINGDFSIMTKKVDLNIEPHFIVLVILDPNLTETGEDSKLVHRRKRPKVDTLFSSLFFDASERRVWLSAESKILASTFGRFRLYKLRNIKVECKKY